jgi:hypothetical protein
MTDLEKVRRCAELIPSWVEKNIEIIPETGCWIWLKSVNDAGYAKKNLGGKYIRVGRWLYEHLNGTIGTLVVDHLCRVRCCVNPAHLEPVTNKENILRGIGWSAINHKKTHCPNGHPYDERYTYTSSDGERRCRECNRISQAKYRRSKSQLVMKK